MRTIPDFTAGATGSITVTRSFGTGPLAGLRGRIRRRAAPLAPVIRQALAGVAATVAVTALILVVSYLFLVTLATYGW